MDEAQETSRSTNGKAIAALIFGLIGMTGVLFVAAIVAIVLGHRSRREIERTGQSGAVLATSGILLGWIALAIVSAFGLFFVLGMMEVL